MANRHGLTVLCMSDRGVMTKQTEKGDYNMQTVTCMMESGKMIKLMAVELILMPTEHDMKANGKKIVSTVAGFKHGQMALNIKDSILREKNMELESYFFQMVAHTKEISLTMISMEEELIDGSKENNTKGIG